MQRHCTGKAAVATAKVDLPAASHGGKDSAEKGGQQKLELAKIIKLKQADSHGKPICRFYNTTSGCKKGAKCNFAHVCAECEGGPCLGHHA